jgi:DNA-directed RNA polymerase subunit RPC12/RpoP
MDHPPHRVGTVDEPAESKDPAIERARVRKLSASSQGHICPRCNSPALVRYRRPFYLRLLRLTGIDLRTYRCAMCGERSIVRHRSQDAP